MIQLLMSPTTGRKIRGLYATVADAVRSVVAPATLIERPEAPAVVEAPDPAGLYEADEMPAIAVIDAAADLYNDAADQARTADRAKRKARKLLDRLPAGTYGQWLIRRIETSRETPDLVAIRATYERLGLGDVPMRKVAPSLRVERIAAAPADADTLAGVTV